ncbi:hypothetical protein BKA56DRAFT_681399 [Ilyonectria sp. MPI-CAGE-AT-0026]|nr:hypothetical protein BKA56DRAFT_681399 [Ilyonectria sp. MPI-CAGE-AT-0026]
MTPRRAKRKLQAVLETDIFNESITNVMKDVITALDVSIISQQAQNRIHKLTEERISREARRTKTRRQIQGVKDGALSMGQLRAKVKARADEEYEDEAKQLTRAQEKMMRDIQKQEQEKARKDRVGQPVLRSRAAAAAKKQAEEDYREKLNSQIPEEEKDQATQLLKQWNKADDLKKWSLYHTRPLPILKMLPEVVKWKREAEA